MLATKLHVILDRGLRRDFLDLYVMLQQQRLGIAAVLAAVHSVHEGQIDDGLMLRALTYFDDADREAGLPGEGRSDWRTVKDDFLKQVGALLTPPCAVLESRRRRWTLTWPDGGVPLDAEDWMQKTATPAVDSVADLSTGKRPRENSP